MRCKRCNEEIEENEIFCDDCKKELKKASSKSEVKELEQLIEEQQKLNELENTKELTDLSVLVEQELKSEEALEDNSATRSIEINEEPIKTREERYIEKNEVVNETREQKNEQINENNTKKKKNRKKKIIIIISSIVLVLIVVIIFSLIFLKKDKEEDKVISIDYKKVMNKYGKSIETIVTEYVDKNKSIPTWGEVSKLNKYNKYEVVCEIHNIYSDGSIYLNDCKINNKKIKYSYGEEKQEIKEGKKLSIYKINYEGGYYDYLDTKNSNSSLVGTITCKGDNCKYIKAYDKYALILEDNEYYLYNYEKDNLEFGPFNMESEYDYSRHILSYNHILYGVYYSENNKNNIYNISTSKTLSNVKGNLLDEGLGFEPSIMCKYGYVVLNNNNGNNFINLKTGNISYIIKEDISEFIEDSKNKIVYIKVYDNSHTKFKIYNSNGKLLFDGKEFTKMKVANDSIIVAFEKQYKVYDSKLNLKVTSKEYDEILGLYDDFIVVLDSNHLEILDLNDSILTTFDEEWDSEKLYFHSMISGWYTDNGKYGIYLVVENKDIPYGTLGSGMEYYFIPKTGETGIINTTGVGGYAKPVLYLYPKEKMNISVTFEKPNMLTTTYPKFNKSWNVVAYPNGDLYDLKGNYYYALYWEEEKNHYVDFSEGFYVTKEEAIEFLEEKLSIIGLNSKERNEFIMYWLPVLEKNEKNLVYFELTNERDLYNKLIINPKPDSILRIAMHVKKVNKKTSIRKQNLTSFERYGFTAVEWGGVIY